eukprot:104648-Amorphochlora_amoeboformis.AAC.1
MQKLLFSLSIFALATCNLGWAVEGPRGERGSLRGYPGRYGIRLSIMGRSRPGWKYGSSVLGGGGGEVGRRRLTNLDEGLVELKDYFHSHPLILPI